LTVDFVMTTDSGGCAATFVASAMAESKALPGSATPPPGPIRGPPRPRCADWQLLYVFGLRCGSGGSSRIAWIFTSRVTSALALAWILFSFSIVMTWHFHQLEFVPRWMIKVIYPVDKTDLDILRLTHFLALAVVVLRTFASNLLPRGLALVLCLLDTHSV
jgi:hypothetical protein